MHGDLVIYPSRSPDCESTTRRSHEAGRMKNQYWSWNEISVDGIPSLFLKHDKLKRRLYTYSQVAHASDSLHQILHQERHFPNHDPPDQPFKLLATKTKTTFFFRPTSPYSPISNPALKKKLPSLDPRPASDPSIVDQAMWKSYDVWRCTLKGWSREGDPSDDFLHFYH